MTPPLAGARRLTAGSANDQLLYFTSNSLVADDQTLVFSSDRDSPIPKDDDPRAAVNLYALDRASGVVRRLTDNTDGYLRSYVYFEGLPYQGLGLASPCLHAASGDLYYLQGREVRVVNAHTGQGRTLATLPAGAVTGFTHISDDNTRLCVPTIDEAVFADIDAIDATVQRLGLVSTMRLFDTTTGEEVAAIPAPRGWVTHVQFQPDDRARILFNHEWSADGGIRRVWLWDGHTGTIRRLREEGSNPAGPPRRREDWVCHEIWTRDGRAVIYHGTYGGLRQSPSFVARRTLDEVAPIEVPFAPELRRYGHFTLGPTDNLLVSDGYAEYDADDAAVEKKTPHLARFGAWISLLRVDWARGTHTWTPLCRHGSSWTSQDAHPHPIFSHAGGEVLFTSDYEGRRAIYALPVAS